MNSSVRVLNQRRSEFDFSNVLNNSNYNIIMHCVYDLNVHFDEELNFLKDSTLDSNTIVILWHAVEQGVWNNSWILKLNAILKDAPYRLVYVTGCSHQPNIDKFFNLNFEVKFSPIFDIRATDMFPFGPIVVSTYKKKSYMFINAADAAHRRYIFGTLLQNNLIDDGNVSYQCCRGKITLNRDFEIQKGFTAEQIDVANFLFNLTDPVVPMLIDDSSVASRLPRRMFLDCYPGIIGETHFVNIPNSFNTSFVTEKTFNAIANNQMFIIVGHAGSLDLLKSLGYKTFDTIIDESYDTILNNGDRLEAVSKEIVRFLARSIDEIKEDYIKVTKIIKHNRDLLFVQNLKDRMQLLIDQL